MAITITSATAGSAAASGLAVDWADGQFVILVAPKGLVACGIIDFSVAEKFNFAVAIAHGTPEKPLVTADDLLEATISEVTRKAMDYGIKKGMSAKEALDLLE